MSVATVFAASCWLAACGGNSASQPTSPSPVPSAPAVIPVALKLDMGNASASFLINRSGGPGLVHYNLGLLVAATEWPSPDVTVLQLEQWALGADGSEYSHRISDNNHRIGLSWSVSGFTGSLFIPDHEFTIRPVARIYRARVEYTHDSGSPAGVQVVTAEREIVSTILSPLMTSLTMTADAPVAPTLAPLRPITFVAAGTGAITPYEYQFRRGNNIILRDWSLDARFVWDPSQSYAFATDITALARSAGRSDAEVMKIMTFYISK